MLGRTLCVRKGSDPFADTTGVFDQLLRGWGTGLAPWGAADQGLSVFSPSIDVTEDDKEYRITAELSGLDEKDVEVSLSGDVLSIKGEKRVEREAKSTDYYRAERVYGAFNRAIVLSADVDQGKVEASFKKGLLTVRLPKTTEAQQQTRKIDVNPA